MGLNGAAEVEVRGKKTDEIPPGAHIPNPAKGKVLIHPSENVNLKIK